MKKITTIAKTFALAAIAVLSMASCGDDPATPAGNTDQDTAKQDTAKVYKYWRGEYKIALATDEFKLYDLKFVYTKADGTKAEVPLDSTNTVKSNLMKEFGTDFTLDENDTVYVYSVTEKYEKLPVSCNVQLVRTRKSEIPEKDRYDIGALVSYSFFSEDAKEATLKTGYEGKFFDPTSEQLKNEDALNTIEKYLANFGTTKKYTYNITSTSVSEQ